MRTSISNMRKLMERRGQGIVMMLLGPIVLSSCAAAPFLVPIAFEFAKNLFQTGLQNSPPLPGQQPPPSPSIF